MLRQLGQALVPLTRTAAFLQDHDTSFRATSRMIQKIEERWSKLEARANQSILEREQSQRLC